MKLKERRPNYFSGYEDKEYEFQTLEELLEIPWVKTKKRDDHVGFRYVFNEEWKPSCNPSNRYPNTGLMVEYWCPKEEKDYFWMVGWIWCTEEEYKELGLPVWVDPTDNPEVTRKGKGEQVFKSKPTETLFQRIKNFFKLGK
jgi:hypothetical protein